MVNPVMAIKFMVTVSILGGLLVVAHSAGGQARTKKQIMVEMGEQFAALDRKMLAGALTAKFSDPDFQEVAASCDSVVRLANEYASLESNKDLASISTNLAASGTYLKQQVAGKDALVVVISYGRLLSFCAECHYQTRWATPEPPPKKK